jgi:hypothetical protein
LISANSAVTVLRSPSRWSGAGFSTTRSGASCDCFGKVSGGCPSGAAHSPQKSSSGSFEALQRGHKRASGAAHFPQNLRPSRLSLPHFEQRMHSPFQRFWTRSAAIGIGSVEARSPRKLRASFITISGMGTTRAPSPRGNARDTLAADTAIHCRPTHQVDDSLLDAGRSYPGVSSGLASAIYDDHVVKLVLRGVCSPSRKSRARPP